MFLGAEIAMLLAAAPDNEARNRAGAALRKVFPIAPDLPEEIKALIARIG